MILCAFSCASALLSEFRSAWCLIVLRMQVMEVVAAYKDTQLPRTVFAGAVPNNWDSPLTYLIEELYKDAAAAAERARLAAESYQ